MALSPPAERILIIDDDVMSRDVLTLLLQSEGFDVHTMPSGEAAILHLRTSPPPTVVLSDLQMPGLSGSALAQALREVCPDAIVLLAMSGSVPPPASTAGFDHFLLKPFQTAQFLGALDLCRTTKVVCTETQTGPKQTPLTPLGASNPVMSTYTDPGLETQPSALASTANQPSSPALDERIYRQLYEAMPGLQLNQMYSLCVEDVRSRIASMRSLVAQNDAEQFVRQAHAIKGGCGMLGASELYSIASSLEKSGLTSAGFHDPSAANPLDELDAACDRLEGILGTRT